MSRSPILWSSLPGHIPFALTSSSTDSSSSVESDGQDFEPPPDLSPPPTVSQNPRFVPQFLDFGDEMLDPNESQSSEDDRENVDRLDWSAIEEHWGPPPNSTGSDSWESPSFSSDISEEEEEGGEGVARERDWIPPVLGMSWHELVDEMCDWTDVEDQFLDVSESWRRGLGQRTDGDESSSEEREVLRSWNGTASGSGQTSSGSLEGSDGEFSVGDERVGNGEEIEGNVIGGVDLWGPRFDASFFLSSDDGEVRPPPREESLEGPFTLMRFGSDDDAELPGKGRETADGRTRRGYGWEFGGAVSRPLLAGVPEERFGPLVEAGQPGIPVRDGPGSDAHRAVPLPGWVGCRGRFPPSGAMLPDSSDFSTPDFGGSEP
jgi:hypothetical protein